MTRTVSLRYWFLLHTYPEVGLLNHVCGSCVFNFLRKFHSVFHSCCCCQLLQSCPTLWDPIDGSLPGSPDPGILQARTLEWVAISFSNVWKWKVKVKLLSCVRLFATAWTAAYQAPPPMGFSRQEYWSGVTLPSPIYIYMYIFIYTYVSCVSIYLYTLKIYG